MSAPHDVLIKITRELEERSQQSRTAYLENLLNSRNRKPNREVMGCANLAHAFVSSKLEQINIKVEQTPNIAIVSSYNDMLSAHHPYAKYPELIKHHATELKMNAQMAGGVPAMCDGVTQGYQGMELSLFSRDVIAQSTALALSHEVFEGALLLGICDKIVPGMLMGALSFGHLPALFMPAGPMPSGISNDQKSKVRQLYAQKKATRAELLESESQAYHTDGTCTFYGTANSNQMLLAFMGLILPGSAFVNPHTDMRAAFNKEAVVQMSHLIQSDQYPIGQIVSEKSIVNAIVGLLATGGSSNHTIHLLAIARMAGIKLLWQDIDQLSKIIPLLAKVYPNGKADVNQFHDQGGVEYVIAQLLDHGLLHPDTLTIMSPTLGDGLHHYTKQGHLDQGRLTWPQPSQDVPDETILRTVDQPFSTFGGIKVVHGNLGEAIIKVSSVLDEHRVIQAPAIVFHDQSELIAAFDQGQLHGKDFVAVVRYQGPMANGMPELHKLTPSLEVLQGLNQKVALLTDGRMSGASGKVLCAIHLSKEALDGGLVAKVLTGDLITIDSELGILELHVDQATLDARSIAPYHPTPSSNWLSLFALNRSNVTPANQGACSIIPFDQI